MSNHAEAESSRMRANAARQKQRATKTSAAVADDQRLSAQLLADQQTAANNSNQVQQLQAMQAAADRHAAKQVLPVLGEGVVQGVFVYSATHGAIHAANKEGSAYGSNGFQRYESADGHLVWSHPGNREIVEAANVPADVVQRQFRIARNKLIAGNLNTEEHQLRGEDDSIDFRLNGETHRDYLIVDPKAGRISLGAHGYLFCISGNNLGAPGQLYQVTQAMVNAFWETPREDEELPPQGSFDPEEGYVRSEALGPDERYNCAAYARGDERAWIEPEDMHEILQGDDYNELGDHTNMVINVDYVFATQFHFWRGKKTGDHQWVTSEKNGASAVYSKTHDDESWGELMQKPNLRIYSRA